MKTIKVQSKYVERKNNPKLCVPELRVSGKWIEETGLIVGIRVEVIVGKNSITFKKVGCNDL
jgi:hypothetical protein